MLQLVFSINRMYGYHFMLSDHLMQFYFILFNILEFGVNVLSFFTVNGYSSLLLFFANIVKYFFTYIF